MKPEESIDIISRMISDTRRGVLQQAYVPFLTWGGSTIAVSLIVFFSLNITNNRLYYLLWFLLPPAGIIMTKLFRHKTTSIRTGITSSLSSIWRMLTILVVSFSLTSYVVQFNVLFYILLMLSIGSYVTGAVIAYPFLKYSSLAGFLVSASLLLISGTTQLPIFAAAVAVMMIVPGMKMKQDLEKL